jgi:hypothetical protein
MNYDLLAILVVITAWATFVLWHKTNRPKFKQLKKKFRKALWERNPIEPKHNKPRFEPLSNSRNDAEAKFFYDFDDFADVMNWYLADADINSSPWWRLQDLPDTDVGTAETGPIFGRTYEVFHNQAKVGKLEIHGSPFYGKKEKTITTGLTLNWVRLLGYYDVVEFLDSLAKHVVDYNPQSSEYTAARNTISAAMLKVLWDSYRISEFDFSGDTKWGKLALYLDGTPTWYFVRRDCEAFAELKRARIAA